MGTRWSRGSRCPAHSSVTPGAGEARSAPWRPLAGQAVWRRIPTKARWEVRLLGRRGGRRGGRLCRPAASGSGHSLLGGPLPVLSFSRRGHRQDYKCGAAVPGISATLVPAGRDTASGQRLAPRPTFRFPARDPARPGDVTSPTFALPVPAGATGRPGIFPASRQQSLWPFSFQTERFPQQHPADQPAKV